MKIKLSLLSSLVFFALLIGVYYIHIKYFTVNVILYSAVLDGLIAASLSGMILFGWNRLNKLNRFEKGQLLVIWGLVGYIFAITVPTIIDRSLSFYILEKIQQRGGGIQLSKFEEVFTKEYVKEYRLVDVRLTEQLESGTITIHDGCVRLTDRGRRLAEFSEYFRKNFLPKKRLLMGEYTDELTDPFSHSTPVFDYGC